MAFNSVIIFAKTTINHAYYERNIIPDLEVSPLENTKALLRKMGMFFRAEANTFLLGYTEGKTEGYFKTEAEQVHLVFGLKNMNPYFQSITDIAAYSPQEQLFLFSNLPIGEIKPQKQFLHQQAKASEEDLVELDAALLNQEDLLGLEVSQFREHYFGLIHIVINKSMLNGQEVQYLIEFNNRKVYWRYFFLNLNDQFKALEIKEKGLVINFTVDKAVHLPNGNKAWQVEFSEEKPLFGFYHNVLSADLTMQSGKNLSIKLPNPTASNIRTIEKNGKKVFCADMYVYL